MKGDPDERGDDELRHGNLSLSLGSERGENYYATAGMMGAISVGCRSPAGASICSTRR